MPCVFGSLYSCVPSLYLCWSIVLKVIYSVAQFLVCALVSLYANLNAVTAEYLYKRHALGSSSCPLYEEPSISGVPCSHFLTDPYFDVGTLQLKYAQKKAMAFCNLLIILLLRCLVDCYIENTVHVFSCSNLPLRGHCFTFLEVGTTACSHQPRCS